MSTFNRPALMELGVLGNQMFIQRKRGARREELRIVYLKEITSASFRRLMRLFEGDVWTDVDGDRKEYKLLGRLGIWSNLHLNGYGVEVTDAFSVPRCCLECPHFESEEYDYDYVLWAEPFCRMCLFFPVRKGTCQVKERTLLLKPVNTLGVLQEAVRR